MSLFIAGIFWSGKAVALTGSEFNPGRIIDDSLFFDNSPMSPSQIQEFLNNKTPVCDTNGQKMYNSTQTRAEWAQANGYPTPPYICLKDYTQDVPTIINGGSDLCKKSINGGVKSAAQIIYDVGQACSVNTQVLIVLLQKEQSLVTDDWPWPRQYRSATGYGCPDTAPCDSEFYGFFNQVYQAAKAFRRYEANPSNYNYRANRINTILWNPNAGCGSSEVFIENQATTGLYIYTPYRPNQAALDNLYGIGDNCSSYGNRNFWRMFNDWFGPSTGEGFVLASSFNDNGDPRQWVVYKGIKRHVPNSEILKAWGLDKKVLLQWNGELLGSYPTENVLTRLMRPTGTLDVYFVDNAKAYKLDSPNSFGSWGFNTNDIRDVSVELGRVPLNSGRLGFSVKDPNSSNIYMVDGLSASGQVVIRRYANPNILMAWEGDNVVPSIVSQEYFDKIDNAISADITSTKITNGSSEFQVVSRQKLPLNFNIAQLYPGVAQQYSNDTIERLVLSEPTSYLIKGSSTPTVYLVDNFKKHKIGSPQLLDSWKSQDNTKVNLVGQASLDLLANGIDINTWTADTGGLLYIIDKKKLPVPAQLDPDFRINGTFFMTNALSSQFSTGDSVKGYLKSSDSPKIYLMDNKILRNIETPDDFKLWNPSASYTQIPPYILAQYAFSGSVGAFVSNGSDEFLIENGKARLVNAATKSSWGLSASKTVNQSTLQRLPFSSPLSNTFIYQGKHYKAHNGTTFMTTDINIAEAWQINNAEVLDTTNLGRYLKLAPMTRFVKSSLPNDRRLFVVDLGKLYYLSPGHAQNLGLNDSAIKMSVNPETITPNITQWQSIIVKDSSGKAYVVDSGKKRPFPSNTVFNHWVTGTSLPIQSSTNGFLNLLPTGNFIERSIKGSGDSIFSAESTTKRWIRSGQTYIKDYAPFAAVSDLLVSLLAPGPDIN